MKASKHNRCNVYVIFFLVVVTVFSGSCTEERLRLGTKTESVTTSENAADINTASAEELARIPHIGPKLAREIIDFRERHGRFRRTEHLMLIRGMSDGRYRKIRVFVKTE